MENDPAARSKIEVFLLYPTIHAVSYTHLDVYKRQEVDNELLFQDASVREEYEALKQFKEQYDKKNNN